MGFSFECGRSGFEGIKNLNDLSVGGNAVVDNTPVEPLSHDFVKTLTPDNVTEPACMPEKRDLLINKSASSMYGSYRGSYHFLKSTLTDLEIQKTELEINVLKDKISAKDVTPAQKKILESMLKDDMDYLQKMQKEQNVK